MRPAGRGDHSAPASSVSPASSGSLRVKGARSASVLIEVVIKNGGARNLKPGHLFFPCLFVPITVTLRLIYYQWGLVSAKHKLACACASVQQWDVGLSRRL